MPVDFSGDRCPLCHEVVDALPAADVEPEIQTLYPPNALNLVRNARLFRIGEHVALHHACSSAQANTDTPWWMPERSWWACAAPTRELDDDAHFDLNCLQCARRWAQRYGAPDFRRKLDG